MDQPPEAQAGDVDARPPARSSSGGRLASRRGSGILRSQEPDPAALSGAAKKKPASALRGSGPGFRSIGGVAPQLSRKQLSMAIFAPLNSLGEPRTARDFEARLSTIVKGCSMVSSPVAIASRCISNYLRVATKVALVPALVALARSEDTVARVRKDHDGQRLDATP